MPVQTVIKVRRDTAANWISTNPTLAAGEMGLETDTDLFKFGNGTSTWTALAYSSSSRTTQIAKNDTGASAPKGSVVYISGANGTNALFSLADADTEVTSSKTVGFLAQTLATNGIGAIVTEGLLSGVNTGTATAGQSVWLSSTSGEFVFGAPPVKPAHSVYLGVVTRAHSTQGEILVKVQNGYELEELHNVTIASPADGDLLAYDSATGLWQNSQPTPVNSATPTTEGIVYGSTDESTTLSTSLGYNATAAGNGDVAVGNGATVNSASNNSIAIGANASVADSVSTVAIGHYADATNGYHGVALGSANIVGTGIAIGRYASSADSSVAIGPMASAASGGIGIGPYANAGASEIVIGDSTITALKVPGVGIDTTTALNGQVLIWDTATSKFIWGTPASESLHPFLLMGA